MEVNELDEVDRGILYLLQRDARNNTTAEIGEKVGVSSSTVGNRINKLEDRGVITGYRPTIDYEKIGLDHRLLVVGTVAFEERAAIADEIMHVSGVVNVRELMTNDQNLVIELVGNTRREVERSLAELNDRGVNIDRMEMMKCQRTQPFDHFGKDSVRRG